MRIAALMATLLGTLTACSATPRAPESSCMQRAVDSLALEGLPDVRKHCLAAGTIAMRCGSSSAFIAGYAKEISDAFGPGDASTDDLSANAAGRSCAERSADGSALAACCADAGY